VTDEEGKPFFRQYAELVGRAKTKTSQPLYAAVLRMAVKASAMSVRSRSPATLPAPSGRSRIQVAKN